MFMLVCFVYVIVPYQETTTLQLYPTAAVVGNTIYVRSQMTDSRQYAESTTLQPWHTAAAVGDTIYVPWRVLAMLRRVACVGACHNLSPHHTTRFFCAAALDTRVHRSGNIGTFVLVII